MTPEPATEQLARQIAGRPPTRRRVDIVALDLRGVAGYTDYFVICSGGSDRQAKAIHDGDPHRRSSTTTDLLPRRVEGLTESRWVLMDYLDVVVHIFTPETRDHYRLESLWGDVPRVSSRSGAPEQSIAAGR